MMNGIDDCLNCELPECDETDPQCLLKDKLISANQKWYIKMKADPVRFAEYKEKKKEGKKKWLSTSEGKRLWNEQCARYRKRYPGKMKDASKRYHEKNKEKRLAQARDYKRKQKLVTAWVSEG